ncbi:battenin isoform X2 [Syngnathus scovelli]|uniref:battenin isoform X2 n=1 Tax=Syngnathus scovelli TaxID=161590 RepID=UPI00211069AC|nr:battenin isoform X2 [Syngnathus scovelli]
MDRSLNADVIQPHHLNDRIKQWRNWSGFWLIGLCNNFAYVVMLSAAQDILTEQESKNTTVLNTSSSVLATEFKDVRTGNSSRYDCNSLSTAAVLLADILPTLVIKLSAPLVIHKVPYGFRVLFCVVMATASFVIVSLSSTVWMSIIGVIFASTSAGLGELSFLALTVFYSRDVLGAWGSGTGGAGVLGALLYSGLTQVGLSPQVTLLIMLTIPFTMLISYFFLLVPPPSFPQWKHGESDNSIETSEERERLMVECQEEQETSSQEDRRSGLLTLTEKFHIIKVLIPFVSALGLVYYAEYFINQGLMELLYFRNFFLTHAEQYRWYQTLYQVGVFISRSSLCCMKIRKLWILALLQVLNAVLVLLEVYYQFLPNAWLVFVIIFYEGLLGGTAYVNTFYFISKETEDRQREFAMAAASVGDSLGIALAAVTAFPVHKYFCSL